MSQVHETAPGAENVEVFPALSVAVAVTFGPKRRLEKANAPVGPAVVKPSYRSPWLPGSEKTSMVQCAQAVPETPASLRSVITGAANYFPLIVHDALMIEPTETESKETMDAFADALAKIAEEARCQPELLHGAPHFTPVSRLDETRAAWNPNLCYKG